MKAFALALLLVGGALANAQAPMGRGPMQGGPMQGGPMQGGYGGAGVDKAAMAKLTKTQTAAEAAFRKNPKNVAARKAYIDATNRHGLAAMRTEALDRKVKYRVALADFRKVLKVDPKNTIAKQNSDLIISIYKSMNRPVPGA